jgi:hypothetical protein
MKKDRGDSNPRRFGHSGPFAIDPPPSPPLGSPYPLETRIQQQLGHQFVGEDAYRANIAPIAREDVEGLFKSHESYGNSWKRRGGSSAWFMLCRKFDRLELQIGRHHFDVFAAALADRRPEGVIDDLRDMRRYLLLVEAEIRFQLSLTAPNIPECPIDFSEPESP